MFLTLYLFSYLRFYSQDDNNIIPSDSYNLKDIESQISNSSVGLKNSMKSETSFVKKPCIIRRTTSLYTAVKRIKNNKKVRQTVTRRPLKNQCVNDIESSSKIPVIGPKSIVKSFLKTSENRLKSSCFGCINDSSEIRDIQYANKKLIATNKFSKMAFSSEETAIVKHGAKRLKIVSMKVNKGKSEVGESSNNVPETIKSPSKTLFLSNKQNVRGTTKAMKKCCHKME